MEKILMTKKEFKQAMEVLKKVAQDDVRPILQGVCFTKNNVVAIDGYRLSVRQLNAELKGEYVILGKDLKEVVRACRRNIEHIEIIFNNDVIFNLYDKGKNLINSFGYKLLDGRFVSYKSLLPVEFKQTVILSKEKILDLIKNVKGYNVALEFIQDKLIINQIEYEGDKHNQRLVFKELGQIELKGEIREPLTVGLNVTYLKEAIKDYKEFKLSYTNKISPLVIEDTEGRYDMILPVRLTGADYKKVS